MKITFYYCYATRIPMRSQGGYTIHLLLNKVIL